MARDVAIIGGGISGLSLAFFFRQRGIRALLLESRDRVGGSIWTEKRDGYILERGPNTSALSNVPLFDLIKGSGLEGDLQFPPPSSRNRFIIREGKLTALPAGPMSLLTTQAFSSRAKLRLIREPFIARGTDRDETVGDFFARRFGPEIADYAVKPFISGIYAGDADLLAMRAAFPGVWDVEQNFGSVITGFIKRARKQKREGTRKPKPPHSGKIFTFTDGLSMLPSALHTLMADDIVTGATDIRFERDGSSAVVSWQQNGQSHTESTARVVISTPAYAAAEILRPHDARLADSLASIAYAPVCIAHLGYKREQVAHSLDGFGFLVPPRENRDVLGGLFSSTMFPHRAPDGHILLTVFMVGMRRPELMKLDDTAMLATATREIGAMLGASGTPSLQVLTRIQRAIPQYTAAYAKVLEQEEAFERTTPNVIVCSSFKGGISVGDCVQSAWNVSEKIAGA